MKLKKLLSVLTVLTLLAAMLPGAALAAKTEVSDWDSLAAALAAGGEVVLAADVARPEGAAMIEVPAGVTAALDLAGHGIDVGGGHALEVTEEEYLGFCVRGALTLTDSAGTGTVTGSCAVEVLGGTFTMAGGSIETDNDGVYVTEAGTFTMTGGYLAAPFPVCTRNYAEDGTRATVDIRGGTVRGGCDGVFDGEKKSYAALDIRDGTLFLSGDAEIVGEAGLTICLERAEGTMTGGTVDGPNCGLFLMESSSFTMSGGTLGSDFYGVFLWDGNRFAMTGGTVEGVCAIYASGDGGDDPCTVDLSGGTVRGGGISDGEHCPALTGWNGVVRIYGDAEIVGVGEIGMGACLYDSESVITGGTVRGSYDGVEVYGGSFDLAGGTIDGGKVGIIFKDGATATFRGGTLSGRGGVALELFEDCDVAVTGGTFRDSIIGIMTFGDLRISGAPEFTGIETTELGLDGLLRFEGPMTAAGPLRVDVAAKPAAGGRTRFTEGLSGNFDGSLLVPGCLGYRIETGDDGEAYFAAEFAPAAYADVAADAWYADDVAFAAHYGLMDAAADGIFAPDAPADRLDAVAALWRIAGCPASDAAIPFDDVAEDSPYAGAVRWAAEAGIIEGVGDGFAPDGTLTREMFVTMADRLLRLKLGANMIEFPPLEPYDFPDADAVSDWAETAMKDMVFYYVIYGMDDGTLNPQGVLTRAQTAAIAYRLMIQFPV